MKTGVGRLFLAGFDGVTLPAAVRTLLREEALGGLVLFGRNIASIEQVRDLIAEAREVAGRPLLVAVDHEGGRVFRMLPPFTVIPPMRTLGDYAARMSDGELVASELGKWMATELATVGININFAPVLDIDTNTDNPIIGDRAFGRDRALVARLGTAMIRGMMEGGVAPCGKHFPGHGDTSVDSHMGLPELPHTLERLEWMELVPFRAAIEAGVPLMMTAHIRYGALDATQPVTFSRPIVHGLLRQRLGFEGVIVSDDLEMGALRHLVPADEAATATIRAGGDLAIICRDVALVARSIVCLREAVVAGTVAVSAITRSIERIERLARRFPSKPSRDLTKVGHPHHPALRAFLQRKGI